MNEQMKKILQQQQEYEYLKKSPSLIHLPNNLFCSSFLTTTVFPYIKSAVSFLLLCFVHCDLLFCYVSLPFDSY